MCSQSRLSSNPEFLDNEMSRTTKFPIRQPTLFQSHRDNLITTEKKFKHSLQPNQLNSTSKLDETERRTDVYKKL